MISAEEIPRVLEGAVGQPSPRVNLTTGPFNLGWVGWFGYEFGAARSGMPMTASRYPQVSLGQIVQMYAFNHETKQVFGVADSVTGLDELEALTRLPLPTVQPVTANLAGTPMWRHEPEQYRALVERCRQEIVSGNAYQLCLTNEVTVAGSFSPVQVYQRLRADNPSHHGALLRLGGVSLLSSSPEVFLRITSDRQISTMPIKGTRRRGITPSEDALLIAELRDSDKEQAENLMIVDLMRNDLSRICQTGSVTAHNLLEVHTLAQVHQLVSTVSGQLLDDATFDKILTATFPAGSMTGAPKIAAMRILHEVENGPRGIYSGAFGWLGADGTCELAMVIRSIVIDDEGASIGTGGGITIDSDPEFELEETKVKAAAGLRALGVL